MVSWWHGVDGGLIVVMTSKLRFTVYKQFNQLNRHSSNPDMDVKTYEVC